MAITDNLPPILEVEDQFSTVTIALPLVPDPSDPYHLPPASIYEREREREVNGGVQKHVHNLGPDGPSRAINDHAQFWSTYDRAADSYDREILDAWNKSLDILLIFAGLFSAINTAFIIESYKGLQPDPAETTNALLRLSIAHRNDNETFSLEDLVPPAPSAVPINSLFFSSLSFSLTAAFGAVTAKQWLTEYANVGIMKVLHVQGKRRQEKLDGLKTWHFRLVIELLPILLQISLLLFLIGIVHFLWTIDRTVAIGQLVLSAAGLIMYIITITIGIFVPTSPFQTPLSRHLPRFFNRIRRALTSSIQSRRVRLLHLQWFTPVISFLGVSNGITYLQEFVVTHLSAFNQRITSAYRNRSSPEEVQISGTQWSRDEIVTAEAIVWLLEQAEHPDVTITALDAVTRLPPDLILSLVQQREGLLERLIRFHNSLIPPRPSLNEGDSWVKTLPNRVIISGEALYHMLKSQRFECRDVVLDSLIQSFERRDFPSLLVRQNQDPVLLRHYLVDLNLCSSGPLQSNHFELLHILASQSDSLGSSPLIQVEPMDARQGLAGSSITSLVLQPELALDFILRVAWTKIHSSSPYVPGVGHIILQPLSILLRGELSRHLVSHLAITFTTVCWSCRQNDPWSYPSEADQRQLEVLLMDRCLAVDKSKTLVENIILALSMIDVANPRDFKNPFSFLSNIAEPNLVPHILHSLIKLATPLLKAEFGALRAKKIPYPNFAQGLLRLSNKLDLDIKTTRHEIAMLLTYCPDGDWLLPTDDGFSDIFQLLASLICNDDHPFTAALLDRMAEASSAVQLLAIVEAIYPYHRSIPFGKDSPNQFIAQVLWLPDHNPSHPSVLLETQIYFSAAMLYKQEMITPVCDFLNRMVQEDSDLHWPAYFIAAGIVPPDTYLGAEPPVLLKSINTDYIRRQVFENQENRDLELEIAWRGEVFLMLWRKGKRETLNGGLPLDWNDSWFFETSAVRVMIGYFQNVRMQSYLGIDWDLVREYFSKALKAMQEEGYDFGYGKSQYTINEVQQVLEELGDHYSDHLPQQRDRNEVQPQTYVDNSSLRLLTAALQSSYSPNLSSEGRTSLVNNEDL